MITTVLSVTVIDRSQINSVSELSHISVCISLRYVNTVLLSIMILSVCVCACVVLSVVPFRTPNGGRPVIKRRSLRKCLSKQKCKNKCPNFYKHERKTEVYDILISCSQNKVMKRIGHPLVAEDIVQSVLKSRHSL